MARLYGICPDADALLELEPEELAGVVLEHLHSLPEKASEFNRHNYTLGETVKEYPRAVQEPLRHALMEAWVWLEREGLLAPRPGDVSWSFITRRGKQIRSRDDLAAYRRASLLPRQLLHGRIAQKVSASFLRGDYDTAVFQAFKEVEVAVREAGGFLPTDIGVSLMRKAFGTGGPLTDSNAPVAEQEALAHLFAGGVGSYKNPHSHRNVTIEPGEAVEMVVLASHLLGIVERRQVPPSS